MKEKFEYYQALTQLIEIFGPGIAFALLTNLLHIKLTDTTLSPIMNVLSFSFATVAYQMDIKHHFHKK